jgi:hypothetical protein
MIAPVISPGAQRGAMVGCQRGGPLQRRSRLVDALVRQPHRWLAGESQAELAADLLRAPPLLQELGHQAPQLAAGLHSPRVTAGRGVRSRRCASNGG